VAALLDDLPGDGFDVYAALVQQHLVEEAPHFPRPLAFKELLGQGPHQGLQLQVLLKQVRDVLLAAQGAQLVSEKAGMGNAAFGGTGKSDVQGLHLRRDT